jgi:shikimate kinase
MKDLIQSKHNSIYLKALIPTLKSRLKEEKALRPMIAHLTDDEALTEFIGKHLFERNVFYQKATTVYPIDGLSVEEIVKGLLSTLA